MIILLSIVTVRRFCDEDVSSRRIESIRVTINIALEYVHFLHSIITSVILGSSAHKCERPCWGYAIPSHTAEDHSSDRFLNEFDNAHAKRYNKNQRGRISPTSISSTDHFIQDGKYMRARDVDLGLSSRINCYAMRFVMSLLDQPFSL